jgi:hypothetical protein
MVRRTLTTVSNLDSYQGFLYQWYDTSTGEVILGPGREPWSQVADQDFTNCQFLSQVDNGWYASGLIVVRQAMPSLRHLADTLLGKMDFGLFYDDRAQTSCNINADLPGGQQTGQMYGGYYVGHPPREGAYQYTPDPSLTYIPTWAGGMFEALMANLVVPETSWSPRAWGLADARTVEVQRRYATEVLGLPVWGMSPSSTPDDTGGYAGYGVEGLEFANHGLGATTDDPNQGLSQCWSCASETVVSPLASFLALDVAPQAAMANIEKLRSQFPDVYGVDGFFDALDPSTGTVGHRYLILDQAMIMAAIDNAVMDRQMQRYFAGSSYAQIPRVELGYERLGLN